MASLGKVVLVCFIQKPGGGYLSEKASWMVFAGTKLGFQRWRHLKKCNGGRSNTIGKIILKTPIKSLDEDCFPFCL